MLTTTRNRTTWIGITAALAVLALGQEASAVPLTLTGPIQGNTVGPQSTSNPCIIAATQCQQPANFGFNNFTSSGAISSYNMFSTTPTATVADGVQGTPYTVGQLEGVLNNSSFNVAIDVNTTAAAGETLQLFEVIVNGAVAYNYVGPTVIGGVANNGNGFADWTLGVVDLSSFASDATVLFHAVWNNASDGGESFFLVSTTQPPLGVPEPATLALLGGALAAMGFIRRSKRV
jgi:PEP-CTERM motif